MTGKPKHLTKTQEQILTEVRRTPSYAEAARRLGLSRERVRQVSTRCGVKSGTNNHLTIREYARRHGYSYDRVLYGVERGNIPAVKMGQCWLISANAAKRCRCGRRLLNLRNRTCSLCRRAYVKKYYHERYIRLKGGNSGTRKSSGYSREP